MYVRDKKLPVMSQRTHDRAPPTLKIYQTTWTRALHCDDVRVLNRNLQLRLTSRPGQGASDESRRGPLAPELSKSLRG
ncbi:unnamed protein product [Arctogadus glacialis]